MTAARSEIQRSIGQKDKPLTNLSASADDIFVSRKLPHPHRPSGVQLLRADADFRPALKKAGYLTRDPRSKERKKYGLKAARRAPQFSKR